MSSNLWIMMRTQKIGIKMDTRGAKKTSMGLVITMERSTQVLDTMFISTRSIGMTTTEYTPVITLGKVVDYSRLSG